MRIAIEAYGYVSTLLANGPKEVELSLPEVRVEDVERALVAAVPELAPSVSGLAYAVGSEAVSREHALVDGQTLVVLSPVSGG